MRPFLRFCASCAFLRPFLLVLFAAFAGHLAAQPANVQADPTTGALFRPAAATFISGNSLLTTSAAAAAYQPLDADLTSWAAVVRASGFDTFVATPSSANLATLVTGETGTGALVFGTAPTFTTPTLGAATATSITGATDLTLAGGTVGTSSVVVSNTTAATTTTSGALRVAGGVGVSGAVTVGGEISGGTTIRVTTAATSIGSLQSFAGDLYISVDQNANGNMIFRRNSGTEAMRITGSTGAVSIASSTASTSTTLGALQVAGGVGVSGALNVGGATSRFSSGSASVVVHGQTGGTGYYLRNGADTADLAAIRNIFGATNDLYFGQNSGWNSIVFQPGGAASLTLASTGAATFAGAVTIAGTVIHTLSATPASATAAGTVGTMSWDANYIYICTATNTWKRVAIATW